MALHSKWTSGDLTFYDGTQDVFTIQDNDEGVTVGEDAGGVDAKFFGGTASAYMLWDANVDDLLFAGGAGLALSGGDILLGDGDYLNFGASKDMTMRWTTGNIFEVLPLAAKSDINLGSATLPVDVKFFGTTGTTEYMLWQSTGHALVFDQADIILRDTDFLNFGDENDMTMSWDTDSFNIIPKTDNADIEFGSSTLAVDIKFFGTTGTTFMQWDSANDKLTFDEADIALGDTDFIKFGDGADITLDWDGDSFNIVGTSGNADIEIGTANIPLKVKFFGSCGGSDYMQWVSSGSELVFDQADISMGNTDYIKFGDSDEFAIAYDGTDSLNIVPNAANADMELGSATFPMDVKFFGATGTSAYMKWTTTGNILNIDGADIILGDADFIKLGDDKDFTINCSVADVLQIIPATDHDDINFGSTVGDKSVDITVFGSTHSKYIKWVSTGNVLDVAGADITVDGGDITLKDNDYIKFGDDDDITVRWDTDSFNIVGTSGNADVELGTANIPLKVKFFGSCGGTDTMQWVSSGSKLVFDQSDISMGDGDYIKFGADDDITLDWDGDSFNIIGTSGNAYVEFGTANIPLKAKFFGSCGGTASMIWQSSGSKLIFEQSDISMGDTDFVKFGDDDDITLTWDGGSFNIVGTSGNADIEFGTANIPLRAKFFGSCGGTAYMQWDSSGSELIFDQADISMGDTDYIKFGDGKDFTLGVTAADVFEILPTTDHNNMNFGSTVGNLSIDMTWYSSTASSTVLFDSVNDLLQLEGVDLLLKDNDELRIGSTGTAGDVVMAWDGTELNVIPAADGTDIFLGSSGGAASLDIKWFGATGADYVFFDNANDLVEFENVDILLKDNAELRIGSTGTVGDMVIKWNATNLSIVPATDHTDMIFGSTVGDKSIDLTYYGSTVSNTIKFSSSGDVVTFAEVDITMATSSQINFRDTNTYINSTAGGSVTVTSTGNIYLNGEVTYPDPTTTNTSGGITLTAASNRVQFVDSCGQNLTIVTPPVADCAGIEFKIANFSTAGLITLNDTGGSAVTKIGFGELGIALCDGTTWAGLTAGTT